MLRILKSGGVADHDHEYRRIKSGEVTEWSQLKKSLLLLSVSDELKKLIKDEFICCCNTLDAILFYTYEPYLLSHSTIRIIHLLDEWRLKVEIPPLWFARRRKEYSCFVIIINSPSIQSYNEIRR